LIMASIPPNQTLYVRNLPEKVQKTELKHSLYCLFSAYGRIMDVVALKTIPARGQAFITFREISSATSALRGLNNFMFYDKSMKIEYAKSKSDAVKKADGTYRRPEKAGDSRVANITNPAAMMAALALGRRDRDNNDMDTEGDGRHARPLDGEEGDEDSAAAMETDGANIDEEPPNKILFLQGLSTDVTEEMLTFLFQRYSGFQEVRLVAGRSDVAFVEYETEQYSALAKDALDGFKLTQTKAIKVSYAKQ